jgi:phosphoesterase RecJ-like protein
VSKKLIQRLKAARRVLLVTHTDPDADALGSCLLCRALIRRLNPQARVSISIDPKHKGELNYFLQRIKNPAGRPDTIVAVDASSAPRLYGLDNLPVDIMFDHHVGNANFGKINIVDPQAASCTLVIYKLLQQLKIKLTKPMAEALYLGLCSDTGNFSFANTDERVFRAALDCTRAGIKPNAIFNRLNEQLERREIMDFARALLSTESHCGGRLIVASIPADSKVDNRNLIDYIRREKHAEAALVLVAKKDHIKISFRSKTALNVAQIAAHFNGGGHKKAAAGKISGKTLAEARKELLAYFSKYIFPPNKT